METKHVQTSSEYEAINFVPQLEERGKKYCLKNSN